MCQLYHINFIAENGQKGGSIVGGMDEGGVEPDQEASTGDDFSHLSADPIGMLGTLFYVVLH